MSTGANLEIVDAALANAPPLHNNTRGSASFEKDEKFVSTSEDLLGPNGEHYPTEEDWRKLRRVYGKINWMSMCTLLHGFCDHALTSDPTTSLYHWYCRNV
jgi:POT family proton-dependent oligopeptide transporter